MAAPAYQITRPLSRLALALNYSSISCLFDIIRYYPIVYMSNERGNPMVFA